MRVLKSKLKNCLNTMPRVSAALRASRLAKLLALPPSVTNWGFRFHGPASMREGTFEVEETKVIITMLKECDVFLNVGANVGYYAAHALQAGVPTVLVEPHPDNVAMLLRNLHANQWKAEVHATACGESNDVFELYGSGTAASLVPGWAGLSTAHSTMVPVTPLDALIGYRFPGQRLFCLVDVEGAELAVLSGAGQLLNRSPRPVWIVEISVDEHYGNGERFNPNLEATFARFFDHGYRAFTLGAAFREVLPDEVKSVAKNRQNTLPVHNFIFAEDDSLAKQLRKKLPGKPPPWESNLKHSDSPE